MNLACLTLIATLTAPAPGFQENLPEVLDRWIEQYVAPIVTREELELYATLSSTDERLAFVERFWQRRDPTPRTPANEYRVAYRQRFLEANRRFTAGRPGWRTDRGRTYILLGPPDSVWAYPSGEGGQGFPAEVWTYNELPSARLAASVDLTFIDFSGVGDYELVSDRDLMFTGRSGGRGRGLEAYSALGPDGTRLRGLDAYRTLQGAREGWNLLDSLAELERLPEPEAPMSRGVVSTDLSLNRLDVRATSGSYRDPGGSTLLAVTFEVAPEGLARAASADGHRYGLDCYGILETPEGDAAARFQKRIDLTVPRGSEEGRRLSYTFGMTAAPGEYTLRLAVVDPRSHRVGGVVRHVLLESFPRADTAPEAVESVGTRPAASLSSVLPIAFEIPVQEEAIVGDPYRTSSGRVVPWVSHRFPVGAEIPVHFVAYDLPDQGLPLTLAILRPTGEVALVAPQDRLIPRDGSLLKVRANLPTEGLKAGVYRLRVSLGQGASRVSREMELELIAPGVEP